MIAPEDLSTALKKKRKKIGETQEKISALTGLSNAQISRIENNDINFSYRNAYKLWNTLKELEEDYKTAQDLMNRNITWARTQDKIIEVVEVMREKDYSQLPVKNQKGNHIGRINSQILVGDKNPDEKIEEYIGPSYTEVNPRTPVNSLEDLIKEDSAVLVREKGEYKGLITRADII